MPTEGAYRKIGNGRPMIAPTKYKNAKKTPPYRRCQKHIHIGGSKCFTGGGVITTIKDVIYIYMKQISKIFVTFGGTLAFGEGKGI